MKKETKFKKEFEKERGFNVALFKGIRLDLYAYNRSHSEDINEMSKEELAELQDLIDDEVFKASLFRIWLNDNYKEKFMDPFFWNSVADEYEYALNDLWSKVIELS